MLPPLISTRKFSLILKQSSVAFSCVGTNAPPAFKKKLSQSACPSVFVIKPLFEGLKINLSRVY